MQAEITPSEEAEEIVEERYLVFPLGDEDCGIAIQAILEVVQLQEITEIPNMPDYIKGVINLRGSIIPIIDLRERFVMSAIDVNERTCIVIVEADESTVGVVVDTVTGVIKIPQHCIVPPPPLQKSERGLYISGMGKIEGEVYILIDIPKLLYHHALPDGVAA